MLFPVENEIRQVKNLNGIWKFRKEEKLGQGFEKKWYAQPLNAFIEMPVPASYNDITTDKSLRDHVGWVWYEREFAIPRAWQDQRIVLRFGSVTHHAVVYVNGKEVMTKGNASIQRLIAAQEEGQRKAMARFIGMEEEVLVEGLSRRSDKQVSGHGRHGVGITLPGTEADIGEIIRVRVTAMKNNTLAGERID